MTTASIDFAITLPHPSIFITALGETCSCEIHLQRRLRNVAMSAIRANLIAMGLSCPRTRVAAIVALRDAARTVRGF